MKIYRYLRVSSDGQVDRDGFPRQREAIDQFCAAHGLEFAGEFREEGVSGTVEAMSRPAFTEMISYAEQQHYPRAVVVERMDRLARDLMVSEMLLKECRDRGIKVFSADQGQLVDMASDGADPTRTLIRQIMGALAQWEKSNLVKKLKGARERAFSKGQVNALGGVPYGMLDNSEKRTLAVMLALWFAFQEDKPSDYARYKAIAGALNDGGVSTRGGKHWTISSVGDILRAHFKREQKKGKNE